MAQPMIPVGEGTDLPVAQLKEFFKNYNEISELCFGHCVHDFTTKVIRKKEETCTHHCIEKYIKVNRRIGQRFQEHQMMLNEAALAGKLPS